MSEAAANAFEKYQAAIGEAEGEGEWFDIDQDRINAFADVTIDHQFIHIDPEAAKATPFGTTIAHGFLTLSMLTHLTGSIPQDASRFAGVVMGINYGFDKVRFVSPVKVGSRIRASAVLANAELKGDNTIQSTRTITVEIEGEDRPALVADWITRIIYG
jgi:acyl dehydratase